MSAGTSGDDSWGRLRTSRDVFAAGPGRVCWRASSVIASNLLAGAVTRQSGDILGRLGPQHRVRGVYA